MSKVAISITLVNFIVTTTTLVATTTTLLSFAASFSFNVVTKGPLVN